MDKKKINKIPDIMIIPLKPNVCFKIFEKSDTPFFPHTEIRHCFISLGTRNQILYTFQNEQSDHKHQVNFYKS